MQEVQLYIDNQRIDLFKDETVSLTQSLQNVKEPAKIFTEFTKSFSVPANSKNNKIFKHYYNYDILQSFDARLKVAGEIKLNYVTYKLGYIKLEGVDLKDNKPSSYRITFFGETVSLKDLLGEDKLSALTWLDNFVIDYSSANVKSYLQDGYDKTVDSVAYTDAIIVPLISHTPRWFYDSTFGHQNNPDDENNLFYDFLYDNGALWSDMKYSIRLHLIIKAIEKEYPEIEFTTDFFNTTNSVYHNLYMWMHRKKGDVQGTATGTTLYSKLVDSWSTINVGSGVVIGDGSSFVISGVFPQVRVDTTLTVDPANDATVYNLKIYKNGNIFQQYNNINGNKTYNFNTLNDGTYTVYVESEAAITFTVLSWEFDYDEYDSELGWVEVDSATSNANGFSISPVFSFYPTQQLPEISIIDFLTGVFKMFNLTAYVDGDKIKVDTLDNFYATYNEYDITKYVDVTSSKSDVALPYKQINFEYEDYKTYLASIFNQLNNAQFGELKYRGEEDLNWEGGIYKVKLPFQKMLYERLNNINGNTQTAIQWGWMTDDNQSPYIGKPLIHYATKQIAGTQLSFRDSDTIKTPLTSYYIPLNTNGTSGTQQSLNFNAEYDEYALITNTSTLFENYYKNYIQDVFNEKRRMIKLKAFLPLKIILKFNLSDRFIVSNKSYKINSINTNLQTGESQIELLNEV